MDKDFSEKPGGGASAAKAIGQTRHRYDFEVPEHLTISDMLAVELADCVRIVQRLADQASDHQLHDTERLHTIHSLQTVIEASETLTRTISRLKNDSWDVESASKGAKR